LRTPARTRTPAAYMKVREIVRMHEDGRMRYAVVIEKAGKNYSAYLPYLPDLPGRVATGMTRKQAETRILSAIRLHLAGMREDGLPIPKPLAVCGYVEA
jgi:predicted RNase H-like HicB family nuclease